MIRSACQIQFARYAVASVCIGLGWFGSVDLTLAAQVNLAWTKANDSRIAGYEIGYGTNSGNTSSLVNAGNVEGYTVSGLQDGQTYFFSVRSYDSSRSLVSSFSNEVTTTTAPAATQAPASGTAITTVYGPGSGTNFTDQVPANQRLTTILVSAGWSIDGVQAGLSGNSLPWHGGSGGTKVAIALDVDDYLVRIDGKYANFVSQLTFVTAKGRSFGPYGQGRDPDGTYATGNFSINASAGNELVGFAGRSGSFLNALGAIQRPRANPVIAPTATPTPTAVIMVAPTATLVPQSAAQSSPIYGGNGGTYFADQAGNNQALSGLQVRAGWSVDALQVFVNGAGLPLRGGTGGSPSSIGLAANEYVVGFSGSYGQYVNKLSFRTNLGNTFGPYGVGRDPDGAYATNSFDFSVPGGNEIIGLTGRSGSFLNAVGVLYRPRAAAIIAVPTPTPAPTATPTPTTAPAGNSSAVFGGAGGATFTDQADANRALTALQVRAGWSIDAIQVFVGGTGMPVRGGAGGTAASASLGSNEYFTSMSGSYAKYVNKLTFTTNLGRSFSYGAGRDPDGTYATSTFGYTVPNGYEISGLSGRAGTYLNAVAAVYRPHSSTAAVMPVANVAADPVGNTAPSAGTTLPGLVAAYSFEEAQGDLVIDSSGNGNHGTATAASRISQGKFGQAMAFNGNLDSYVTVADSASLHLNSGMTLEAWVYRTSTAEEWGTVLTKEMPNGVAYYLYANTTHGGRPITGTRDGASNYHEMVGPAPLPAYRWTHLVGTYDGREQRLYIDGRLVTVDALSGALAGSDGVLRIGGNAGGEAFTGYLDEVRVYNRALSSDEVAADFSRPASDATEVNALLGSTSLAPNSVELAAGRAIAYLVDPARSNGQLTGLSVYADNGSALVSLVGGVYADANGRPGALKSSTTLAKPVTGWNTLPLVPSAVSMGQRYWVAVLSPAGSGNLLLRASLGGSGLVQDTLEGDLSFLPTAWHTGTQSANGPLSLYGSGY